MADAGIVERVIHIEEVKLTLTLDEARALVSLVTHARQSQGEDGPAGQIDNIRAALRGLDLSDFDRVFRTTGEVVFSAYQPR